MADRENKPKVEPEEKVKVDSGAGVEAERDSSVETEVEVEFNDIDAKLKALEDAEMAIDSAYKTGKVERAKITQMAQLDAAEAVAMAGIAMEADVEADEAMRISVIASKSGDRTKAKEARAKEKEARKTANRDHKAATKSARKAYEAIKFSAPNRMGFMRFVQIAFAIHIVVVLFSLIMTSRDTVIYDSNNIITWIMIVLEGVAFWFFLNRYKVGRPFVICMAIFGIVAPTVYGLATGTYNIFNIGGNATFYIFLIFYFALSRRVKATLVNSFSFKDSAKKTDGLVISRKSWPFVRNCIMYFFIFSEVGHWMEAGMCQLIRLGLVDGEYDPTNTMLWRDLLYPFAMEGIAVVLIAIALYPLLQKMRKVIKIPLVPYAISFVVNGLFCSLIEFFSGLIVNPNHELWDYSDQFCNIMGQVCLQNALAFAAAASIITWFVYPLMEYLFSRIREDVMNVVFVVVVMIGAALWSLYIIDPPGAHEDGEVAVPVTQAEKEYDDMRLSLDFIDGQVDGIEHTLGLVEAIDPTKPREELQELRAALQALDADLAGQANAAHEQAKKEAEEKAAQTKAEKEAERDEWAAQHGQSGGSDSNGSAEADKSAEAEKKAA